MCAASFEDGLSLQDMLRLQRQKQAAAPGLRAEVPDTSPDGVAPETRGIDGAPVKLIGELPCVFTPKEQPDYEPGDDITLGFFDVRYRKLWDYARAHTRGAVAVRYAKASHKKSFEAFVVWPRDPQDNSVTGPNLGCFEISVVTVHPFPLVRLLAPGGIDAAPSASPAELNSFLRSRSIVASQEALRGMSEADRRALVAWLSEGSET